MNDPQSNRVEDSGRNLPVREVSLVNTEPTIIADFTVARREDGPVAVRDCWNQIGVGGNQTCRELPHYFHCHHCPVYSAAAVRLLDRPLSIEDRRAWTEHYAHEKRLSAPAKTSALLFRIGAEWLALPAAAFQEITERRVWHSLPHRRQDFVLGLVNVRGELLICASLARLLGLESELPNQCGARHNPRRHPAAAPMAHFSFLNFNSIDRLLVADWDGQRFVFPVDEVHGVHRFHLSDLREPPATVARSGLNCTRGIFPWRNFAVGLLDADAVFAALNRNLA